MFEKDEVYNVIHDALTKRIDSADHETRVFIHEVALTARSSVIDYVRDLEEAVGHLQETVKRLSKS